MRILIETEEKSAGSRSVSPAVTVALPTTDTHDAGAAPPDNAIPTVAVTTMAASATDAGGPPDWLIEAIGSASTNQSVSSISNGIGINGGQGM